MSTTEIKFDLYQTVTDKVITLLEQGIVPWRKPWSSAGPPMNAISKRPYQGINIWLLPILNYESNLFLTWDQLKKIGGSVNRGEQGHIVVYWHIPEKKEEKENLDNPDEEKLLKPQLRYHKVFNLDQCSGIPASVTVSSLGRQNDPLKACELVVENMQNPPRIMLGKRRAEYDVVMDYVNMPRLKSFESSEAYYTTLFHELVHSTGHEKRLHRKTLSEMAEFGSEPYSVEELVAELGTCYLAAHTNILNKQIQNSTAYIQGWLSKLKDDKRIIVLASSQAQKASDYILNVAKEDSKEPITKANVDQ